MPVLTPDYSEAVELQVVPAGTYNARIVDAKPMTAKSTGNPYIKWELQIFGATGDYQKFNNAKLWTNTMLTGRGAGMLKTFVKAVNPEYDGGPVDTDACMGKGIQVVVVDGVDQQGQKTIYPEVKAVRSL